MHHSTATATNDSIQPSTAPSTDNTGNTINFFECLETLFKHRRLIIATTLIAIVFSVVYSLLIPKSYKSTTLILPPQQQNSMMGLMLGQMGGGMSSLASEFIGKGSAADLYVGILNSDAICDVIIDRFKLMDVYKTKYRVDAYKVLRRKTEIIASKKSGIISISVMAKDPKAAADMANAYVDELSKLTVGLSITGAGKDKAYLEERLAKTKIDLAKAEENMKIFQSRNKTLDVSEQAKGTIKGVAELEGQLAAEEIRLASIRRVFTDASQEVRNQRMVVSNLRGQIKKFEGNRSGSSVPGVGSVPELGQQYLRLMREFKIQEALLEVLTKQYEMAKMVESKDVSSLQVIQKAKASDKKTKPIRSLIVLAITFMAFTTSIVFVLVRNYLTYLPEDRREQWNRIISIVKG